MGAGQHLQAVDASGGVSCGTDADSGGDITGVSAGSGLTGGATSGQATLGVAVPLQLTQSNAGSTDEAASLTQAGIGHGLNINMSNASSSARGINVSQSGVGPAVFASSGGNGLWGLTSSISSAAVIGDSPAGEVIVGRQSGTGCGTLPGRATGSARPSGATMVPSAPASAASTRIQPALRRSRADRLLQRHRHRREGRECQLGQRRPRCRGRDERRRRGRPRCRHRDQHGGASQDCENVWRGLADRAAGDE